MVRLPGVLLLLGLAGCGASDHSENAVDHGTLVDQSQTSQESAVETNSASPTTSGTAAGVQLRLSEETNTVSQKPVLVIEDFAAEINNLSWSPDSQKVASGTTGSSDDEGKLEPAEVKVWDTATGKELLAIETPAATRNSVHWSPDGSRLAIKSEGQLSFTDGTQAPGRLRVVAADSGAEHISLEVESHFMLGSSGAILWSPDGQSLTGLIENGCAVWQAATGKRIQTLDYTDFEHSALSVAWSPDGAQIAVGCSEGIIDIWNVVSGKLRKTFRSGSLKIGNQSIKMPTFSAMVNSVVWGPQEKFVASANDLRVSLWDVASGKEAGTFSAGAEHLAWSPDGTQLAGSTGLGSTDSLTIWHITQNTEAYAFVAHQIKVSSLSWSPDGDKLASGGKERGAGFLEENFTLKIWSVAKD